MAEGGAGGETLAEAADALRAGGVVVVPTDTVYGVAALPSLPGATDRLFELKGRDRTQPLAVLVADGAQAATLVAPLSTVVERWMARYWPGPLTLVLARAPGPARDLELGGDPATVGVRCPAHDLVRQLSAMVGPMATTSANRHGEVTRPTAAEAAAALSGPVDVVVDGGPCAGVPSTVVDATGPKWHVRREGAITRRALAAAARP